MSVINNSINVFNEPLMICGTSPMTGAYRDGCCNTGMNDRGTHTVCAVVTNAFLQYSKSMGNDLITPRSKMFPGLVAGDKWCLCVLRWLEAYNAGKAPKIIPESTNSAALEYTTLDILMKYRQI